MKERDEVLRYLGYAGQPLSSETETQIRRAMEECRTLARPRGVWREVRADEAPFPGAVKVWAFAVTLGVLVERRIGRLQLTDMTYALILDAAATQYIEQACDDIERDIRAREERAGICAEPRVSPGYGKLPIGMQPWLLRRLDAARTIGLCVTGALVLTPQKSVTALIPFYERGKGTARGCAVCASRRDCVYRKERNE